MNVYFITDLHGSRGHYEQALEQLRTRNYDVLILGGDMHPDGDRGIPLPSVSRYIRGTFRQFLEQAHELCPGLTILAVLGNHDWYFAIEEYRSLEQAGLLTLLWHDRYLPLGDFDVMGLSYSPPAPYWIKDFERRDRSEDAPSDFGGYTWCGERETIVPVVGREYFSQLASIEQILASAPQTDRPVILISHAPPVNTHTDPLPGFGHVGSYAVRAFIEQRQPRFSLHGHIHEAPSESGHVTDRLGECVCINPGQEHDRLCGLSWDTETGRLEHSLGYVL